MADNARLFLLLTAPSGAIKGESRVAGKRDWIEIDDWNWKLAPPKEKKKGAGTVQPSELSFTKTMDRATTAMLTSMSKGEMLGATIEMEDASLRLFNLKLILTKVRILSYEVSTQITEKRVSVGETWTFDYDSLKFEYQADSKSGAMQVELTRPPGSSTNSLNDKDAKFKELSEDMSVKDLAEVWKNMQLVRDASADVKKALADKKAKAEAKPGAKSVGG